MIKTSEYAQSRSFLHTHTHTHGCLCKIIIPAIFAIATTIPTYATNIDNNNKGCTSGTLTVNSGSAALEADWAANTVGVTWYNGDTQYSTGQCLYDGTLTLPSAPTKTGYTFAGWKVRSASCIGAACLDRNLNGNRWYSRGYNGTDDKCQRLGPSTDCSNSLFDDLERYEWKTEFDYGMVKGTSVCAGNSETYLWQTGTPSGNGKYCWCKATEINGKTESLSWVYSTSSSAYSGNYFSSEKSCQSGCAFRCAYDLGSNSYFRTSVYVRKDVASCASVTNKNACGISFDVNNDRCSWSDSASACFSPRVNDCSVIVYKDRCDFSSNSGVSCIWSSSASACVNPKVSNCSTINSQEVCDRSMTNNDALCMWSNSSCHTVNSCEDITNEDFCDGSQFDGVDCVWSDSESACYSTEVEDCSIITDGDRCNSSRIDYDYACMWDGSSCYEYLDD